MTKISNTTILSMAADLYAKQGMENFSMRKLASDLGVAHSVVYHYYQDEESLLRAMYDWVNTELGIRRKALPAAKSADAMLKQRIAFQIDNTELIVTVLKYYLAHRHLFKPHEGGFVPDKSTLHIEEVLEFGLRKKEFTVVDLKDDAKVITHAINGFLLEYYPHKPEGKEKIALIRRIHSFLLRALKGGEKHE